MKEDRYKIVKLLGKGRTGGIYEAEDSTLGRTVAIRRFFAQGKNTCISEYKEDFLEVSHLLSGLQHPNLLRIYDAGLDNDGAFVISQLVKGISLHDRMKEGPLSVYDTYDLAQQMLDALSTSHGQGFIHGAITPSSIMLSPRARGGYLYVILDMGLSRLAPLIQKKGSVLAFMGDPAMLAPELFKGGEATEQADLYMLGQILYMCIAGGHPFGGASLEEAEEMHLNGLPPLQDYLQFIPDDFRIWIESLVKIDQNARPASAIEAIESLCKIKLPAKTEPVIITEQPTPALASQQPSNATQLLTGNNAPPTAIMPINSNGLVNGVIFPKQEDSNKALFILLGLVSLMVAITGVILFS